MTTIGTRRSSVRAAPSWLLAALLIVLLAACAPGAGTVTTTNNSSDGPAATGANLASVDPADSGRLYAQCMRANGVPDFPDPGPDGQFGLTHGDGGVNQDAPEFRAATEKCRALAPGGEHETLDASAVEQMRAFSLCMRENGLPDFPDPDADGRLRGTGHEAGGPGYQAAFEACRAKLPGGGEH